MRNKVLLLSFAFVCAFVLTACSSKDEPKSENKENNSNTTETQVTPTAAAKNLDTTDKNPGTSINPQDKGKTVETDQFRYKLLDVREDTVDAVYGGGKVLLVKLEVERIGVNDSSDPDDFTGLSALEVGLTGDPTGVDSSKSLGFDFYYQRSKIGVALGEDVDELKMGDKVVGYYTYTADKAEEQAELYFIMKNFAADSVTNGTLGKVMGTFRVK